MRLPQASGAGPDAGPSITESGGARPQKRLYNVYALFPLAKDTRPASRA